MLRGNLHYRRNFHWKGFWLRTFDLVLSRFGFGDDGRNGFRPNLHVRNLSIESVVTIVDLKRIDQLRRLGKIGFVDIVLVRRNSDRGLF